MNNRAFSKIWIVIILIVLVGGGIFAWQYFRTPEKEIGDETADWKTYRNEEYGFEIKHPEDWHLHQVTYPEGVVLNMDTLIFSNLSEKERVKEIMDLVEAREKEKLSELKDCYYLMLVIRKPGKPFNKWLEESKAYMEQYGIKTFREEAVIGNIQGYKITYEMEDGEKGFSWVFPGGENVYSAENVCPTECEVSWETEECEVFQQMFSTFKFLE